MAASMITCVLVLLCQAWVVQSAYCARGIYSFYCCGSCVDLNGDGDDTCVTKDGNYYSYYSCYTYYTKYYNNYYYYDYTISAGAIVGIIMGCLAGLGIIVSITICLCIKCCRTQPSSTTGIVLHSGQMSVITTSNTSTQGLSGYPVQGQNMPMYANQQGTPNYTPTSLPNGMTNQAYASDGNLSQPPPSYEQVLSGYPKYDNKV